MIPRSQRARLFLDYGVSDAQVVLQQHVEAFQGPYARAGNREDLVKLCELYTKACADFLGLRSRSSSKAKWFSEALVGQLLKAFALIEIKPVYLLQACDFTRGGLDYLSSQQNDAFLAVIKAIGFEESKTKYATTELRFLVCQIADSVSRLTSAVLVTADFASRYRVLHQLPYLFDDKNEGLTPNPDVLLWAKEQTKAALGDCSLTGSLLDMLEEVYKNYGFEYLEM